MQLAVVLLACYSVVIAAESVRPRSMIPPHPSMRLNFSKEALFTATKVLFDDIEMSTIIGTRNSSYSYMHSKDGPLTLVVRPCSTAINVTVYHCPQGETPGKLIDYVQGLRGPASATSQGKKLHIFSWPKAKAGLYLLDLVAELHDTWVTMYASRDPPAALRIEPQARARIQRRLHRDRVTLRWDQSLVVPHSMNYCVVVSSKHNYSCLCEAYSNPNTTKFEDRLYKKGGSPKSQVKSKVFHPPLGKNDVFVTCVGAGLSYTISDLEKGRGYYFSIFAQIRNTNLSFLYGSKYLRYDPKLQPIGLKDNKPKTVKIRELGGRVIFRYKVGVKMAHAYNSTLSWHVMPCGSAVTVELRLRRVVVVPRQVVEGHRHLQVPHPKPGNRYSLLVFVANPHQLRQIMGVEVLATMRTSPLPQLPPEAAVHEYESMRTCDSVTVGWVPTPSQFVRYCVSASRVSLTESQGHFWPRPNQCNLEHRLRSQLDFTVKQCQDFTANDNTNVLVQTISKLRPGKEYLIQVTVKKIKGKALSYDLLRVRTKSKCK